MNPDLKVYDTVITLENGGDLSLLRSGMSCSAEIIVEQYDDAIYVPVQAVMSVGGKSTVYIVKGEKLKPRTVETGLDNNIVIRIKSGLEPGELVSLSPPLAQSAVAEQTYEKLTTDMKVTNDGTAKSVDQNSGTGTPAAPTGNQGAAPSQGAMPSQTQGAMSQGSMPAQGQGAMSQGAMPAQGQAGMPSQGSMPAQGGAQAGGNFITRFDKDGDGKISKSEVQGQENLFTRFDKNGDGYITKDEAPQGRPSGSQSRTQGETQSSGRYSTTGSTSESSSSSGEMGGGGGPGGGPGGGGGGGGMP
jgi:HlyD family secretion protein